MSRVVDSALRRYALAAREHGQATESGDPKRANRAYRRLARALREMLAEDPENRLKLSPLLADGHSSVRCWAATHLLPVAPERAIQVLRDLSETKGFIGL